jgi:transketolase
VRTAFIEALMQIAAVDPRVMLIVGDLGYSVVEDFERRFPKQFVNAGVAEQNMTGLAAGLALAGRIVFTYSIGNFPTLRCLEQLRNDICYHRAPVKIVAVGGGFGYGALGVSHHATEDLAIMRALPNMTVVAPGDPIEAGLATKAVAREAGPCYLRLGKSGERTVHPRVIDFRVGRAIRLREGTDVTLIVTGGMLHEVMMAAEELSETHRIEAAVLSMHTIKPLDAGAVLDAARRTPVVTIEEHSVIGGLGSAVAEVLAEASHATPFNRIAVPSEFSTVVGSQQYFRQRYGLTAPALVERLKTIMTNSRFVQPCGQVQ